MRPDTAAAAWPPLISLTRLGCALFLAGTAVRLWRGAASLAAKPAAAITVRAITLATLINPKAVLMATGVFAPAAFVQPDLFHATAFAFAIILVPIALGWVSFGALLVAGGGLVSPRTIHRAAAILLACFSASVGVSAVM